MSVPAKFERYEIFRILLPGFYGISVCLITFYSFFPTREFLTQIIESNAFLIITGIGGIFMGMLLYAWDYPTKNQFYNEKIKPNQPHIYLRELLCSSCKTQCENYMKNDDDAKPVYFYLLYSFFDTTSQGVIHYFGSVYRVFAYIRAISGLFGWFEISLALTVLFISIIYKIENYEFVLLNTIIPFIMGIIFIFIWIRLHPEFFNKTKLSKGDNYMLQIIDFQKRYLELEKERIKVKICKK